MVSQNAIWPNLQPETVPNASPVLEFMKYDNERLDPIISTLDISKHLSRQPLNLVQVRTNLLA